MCTWDANYTFMPSTHTAPSPYKNLHRHSGNRISLTPNIAIEFGKRLNFQMNPPAMAPCYVFIKISLFKSQLASTAVQMQRLFRKRRNEGGGSQRQREKKRDINKQIVNPPCLYHPPLSFCFSPKSNSWWHKKGESLFWCLCRVEAIYWTGI